MNCSKAAFANEFANVLTNTVIILMNEANDVANLGHYGFDKMSCLVAWSCDLGAEDSAA